MLTRHLIVNEAGEIFIPAELISASHPQYISIYQKHRTNDYMPQSSPRKRLIDLAHGSTIPILPDDFVAASGHMIHSSYFVWYLMILFCVE